MDQEASQATGTTMTTMDNHLAYQPVPNDLYPRFEKEGGGRGQSRPEGSSGDGRSASVATPEDRRSLFQEEDFRRSPRGSSPKSRQRNHEEDDAAWRVPPASPRSGNRTSPRVANENQSQLERPVKAVKTPAPPSLYQHRRRDSPSERDALYEPSPYQPDLGQYAAAGRASPATVDDNDSHRELLAAVQASFDQHHAATCSSPQSSSRSSTGLLNVTPQVNFSTNDDSESKHQRRQEAASYGTSSRQGVDRYGNPSRQEADMVSKNDESMVSNTEHNEQVEQILMEESMKCSSQMLSFDRELGDDNNSFVLGHVSSCDDEYDGEEAEKEQQADGQQQEETEKGDIAFSNDKGIPFVQDSQTEFFLEEEKKEDFDFDSDSFHADFSVDEDAHAQKAREKQSAIFDPFTSGFIDGNAKAVEKSDTIDRILPLDFDPTLADNEAGRHQGKQQKQRSSPPPSPSPGSTDPVEGRHAPPKLQPSRRDLLAKQQRKPGSSPSPVKKKSSPTSGRRTRSRDPPVDLDETVDTSGDNFDSSVAAVVASNNRDPPTSGLTTRIEERWAAAAKQNTSAKTPKKPKSKLYKSASPTAVEDLAFLEDKKASTLANKAADQEVEYDGEEFDVEMVNAFLVQQKRRPMNHFRSCVRCLLE